MSRARNLAGLGSAVTNPQNPVNIKVGYVTAIAYYGDGSELTGTPGGLGTALAQDLNSPLNKIYYTNQNLSIGATITVDPPTSAKVAYTQYSNIVLTNDADLIVSDGDDFIPDILGIGTQVDSPGTLSGTNSKLRVDNITNKGGFNSPAFPYGLNVGSGTTIKSPATNTLAFDTNNTEALRIDSAGNVGVGEATPDVRLHVKETINVAYSVANAADDVNNLLKLENPSTTANAFAGMQFRTGNGADMFFGAIQQSANAGDFYFVNQNSPNKELLRIPSSGGITFNGDTAAANTLDDYEEGTWTPVFYFGGAASGAVFSMQEGHYVKIGRQVIAQFRLQLSNKGSSTGTMTISTPFTVLNTFSSTGVDGNVLVAYSSGMNASNVGSADLSGYCEGGTSLSYYSARLSTGNAATMNNTDCENDFSISGTMFFYAA